MHETRGRHESDLITAILKMPLIERVIRLAYNPEPPPHQCSPCILFFFISPLPNTLGFLQRQKICILLLDENRKECEQEHRCNYVTPSTEHVNAGGISPNIHPLRLPFSIWHHSEQNFEPCDLCQFCFTTHTNAHLGEVDVFSLVASKYFGLVLTVESTVMP